jgi:hypothetical protein
MEGHERGWKHSTAKYSSFLPWNIRSEMCQLWSGHGTYRWMWIWLCWAQGHTRNNTEAPSTDNMAGITSVGTPRTLRCRWQWCCKSKISSGLELSAPQLPSRTSSERCHHENWFSMLSKWERRHTQYVQVLLGLCSLKIQDLNYFQNFTPFI